MTYIPKSSLFCALLAVVTPALAQDAPAPALAAPDTNPISALDTDAVTKTPQGMIKFKVVAPKNLFAPPVVKRPLKVAVYSKTETNSDAKALMLAARRLKGCEVKALAPEDFSTYDLSAFDVVVFPGGSGSSQAKLIGEKGLENVRTFIKNGGSYLGICAGAYLATSGYPWSLSLYNAKTRQPWSRGNGAVSIEFTPEGKALFGELPGSFPVFYNGGPMIEPDDKNELQNYKVLATFCDEVSRQPEQVGQMVGAPAIVTSTYGQGTVLTISPHFESTRNLENFLPSAIAWLGEKAQ